MAVAAVVGEVGRDTGVDVGDERLGLPPPGQIEDLGRQLHDLGVRGFTHACGPPLAVDVGDCGGRAGFRGAPGTAVRGLGRGGEPPAYWLGRRPSRPVPG